MDTRKINEGTYADVVVVIITGPFVIVVIEIIDHILDVGVNTDKTDLLVFNNRRDIPYLSYNSGSKTHMESLHYSTDSKRHRKHYTLTGKNWGLNMRIVLGKFTVVVRPMEYRHMKLSTENIICGRD